MGNRRTERRETAGERLARCASACVVLALCLLLAARALGVMLISDPKELLDAHVMASVDEEEKSEARPKGPAKPKVNKKDMPARIRSKSSDFDRKAGVILFEGDVRVDYESDYTLCADRVFAFLTASNRISRVVALGNVSITNEERVGTCAMATYRQRTCEVEMFGEKGGAKARLVEDGDQESEVQGDRIRFWIDSEEVEVMNSAISAEHGEVKKEDL